MRLLLGFTPAWTDSVPKRLTCQLILVFYSLELVMVLFCATYRRETIERN